MEGEKGGNLEGGATLEEEIEVYRADSVDSAQLGGLEFSRFNELQYSQMMELQGSCDVFRRHQSLNHFI